MLARAIVSLLAASMLVVTFQNCAGGGFDTYNAINGKVDGASSGDPNNPDSGKDPDDAIPIDASVYSAISAFKPALAIRGVSCIFCHAEVNSNIISDFGYSSTPAHNFFMNGNDPRSTNHYGDRKHGGEASSLQTLKTTGKETFTVPRAQFNGSQASQLGNNLLHEYVNRMLASSTYPSSRTTKVEARDVVNISSISETRMRQAFGADETTPLKFHPSKDGHQFAEGLDYDFNNRFFSVSNKILVCNGDLYVDGVLHLNHATIATKSGCRIHATRTIFVNGPLKIQQADPADSKHNVQLMSSTAVLMGMGSLFRNSKLCDTGWYVNNKDGSGNHYNNTLKFRINHFFQSGFGISDSKHYSSEALRSRIITDIGKLPTVNVFDASCEPTGRNVSFERLLINAPLVMNRFNGNFKGSIIAELSLMSLGQFKFSFDPVFTKVAPFPKFKSHEILDIQ
ncbi:MAG: hypothetical protein ACLGGX_04665 [Bdellovibrionia bacterium]